MTKVDLEAALKLDFEKEIAKITTAIRDALMKKTRKRGLVIAMSGGIDSSVCAALSVKAIGPERTYGLLLPEKENSPSSTARGKQLAEFLKMPYEKIDLTPTLEAIGCYKARDQAIKETFPEYGAGWKHKIIISGGTEGQYNHFKLVVQSPDGGLQEKRLGDKQYLTIVAAVNYKQRIRKTMDYFHADRLNYAVVGTPNRLEYDQGFFVKNGDGSADVKPIAHLYKTQVYAMARYLKLPDEICGATPTTDTYSLPQGQDEFYFALPYQQMDKALWAYIHNVSAEDLAAGLGIDAKRAAFIYKDIEAKRRTAAYLHDAPILVESI